MECQDPFHVYCRDVESEEIQNNKTNEILPDVQCPTCSEQIEGRHIPLDSVQVYSATLQKLVGLRDSTDGVLDYKSNRVHPYGHGLISNPSTLRSRYPDPLLCALCLGEVWPAEDKVVHNNGQCLALFHDKCLILDTRRDPSSWKETPEEVGILEPSRCPSCWAFIHAESEEELEAKLVLDDEIRRYERPPRRLVQLDVTLISAKSAQKLETLHPKYYDLQPGAGRPVGRLVECVICKEVKPGEATWIHRAGHCLNSFHQQCLQSWIDVPREQEGKEAWELGPTCPACRAILKERPEQPGQDSLEFGSSDIVSSFTDLPEEVQDEVIRREKEEYEGWPIVVWTDRLRPAICSEGKCCM